MAVPPAVLKVRFSGPDPDSVIREAMTWTQAHRGLSPDSWWCLARAPRGRVYRNQQDPSLSLWLNFSKAAPSGMEVEAELTLGAS